MNTVKEYTDYLFNCRFTDEAFDPEEHEEHLKLSWDLFDSFSWDEIYPVWLEHLRTQCKTPEAVINFVNLYVYYEASDRPVPDPFEFIGYLYSKVDMDLHWDEAGELFEGLAINILSKTGYLNLTDAPYYSPLKDERVLNSIAQWRHNPES